MYFSTAHDDLLNIVYFGLQPRIKCMSIYTLVTMAGKLTDFAIDHPVLWAVLCTCTLCLANKLFDATKRQHYCIKQKVMLCCKQNLCL